MNDQIEIIEADTKKLMNRFIRFPHQLYRHDPYYVPVLNLLPEQLLSKKKNPFFQKGAVACFLAINEHNQIVGRIAAIYNQVHLEIYNDDTGFFGFFDCVDDPQIAGQLLNRAALWLKSKGLKKMTGPENLTTNDSVGILVKGFYDSPCFLMPYNFPYYYHLLEQNNFKKVLNLYSYKTEPATLPDNIYEKSNVFENRLRRHGITFRLLNNKKFQEEIKALQKVYNAVNKDNWGFMPLGEIAFRHMADDLRQIIDEESVILAEKEGSLIGFIVSIPDYNQVFKKIPRGALFPFGWFRLLIGRKWIRRIRILIMGVLPEWRGRGIDWCLYAKVADYAKRRNLDYGEASYVMENNIAMNKMMNALGGYVVKEYQLFEKSI